jgi:hypothetical protein
MLAQIDYINGFSKVIDKIRVIISFEPEEDKNLLITGQSQFSEAYYVPKADFIADLHSRIKTDGMPYWLYANFFEFE